MLHSKELHIVDLMVPVTLGVCEQARKQGCSHNRLIFGQWIRNLNRLDGVGLLIQGGCDRKRPDDKMRSSLPPSCRIVGDRFSHVHADLPSGQAAEWGCRLLAAWSECYRSRKHAQSPRSNRLLGLTSGRKVGTVTPNVSDTIKPRRVRMSRISFPSISVPNTKLARSGRSLMLIASRLPG